MSKALVAYFSASGVTAKLAERLAEGIGADLYEIKPETPYTKADLNWQDSKSRSSVEMNDRACRPAIKTKVDDMDQYDIVFVKHMNHIPIFQWTFPPYDRSME